MRYALLGLAIYLVVCMTVAWLIRYHDNLARERDQAEHKRWLARQQEAEACLIREKVRQMEAHREMMEVHVSSARRIHEAFHPEDDEPWKHG